MSALHAMGLNRKQHLYTHWPLIRQIISILLADSRSVTRHFTWPAKRLFSARGRIFASPLHFQNPARREAIRRTRILIWSCPGNSLTAAIGNGWMTLMVFQTALTA